MILYGSGMGNGNLHAAYPLPLVLVGGKSLSRAIDTWCRPRTAPTRT